MADYNSSYTGQQIDNGVGIALAVPDTYRTAAAQDVIDAGLVSGVAAQTFSEAQQQQARANIGATGEWVLLWENASTNSSFPEQRISIDITRYAQIAISIVRNNAESRPLCLHLPNAVFTVEDLIETNQSFYFGPVDANNNMGRRFISGVNASGFTISKSWYSGDANSNNTLIPSAIYGRK